jgi:hypothetical protein
MGAGVAGQCSENRCLARWTVWIPHRGRGGGAGRANSRKRPCHGPIRGFVLYREPGVHSLLEHPKRRWLLSVA